VLADSDGLRTAATTPAPAAGPAQPRLSGGPARPPPSRLDGGWDGARVGGWEGGGLSEHLAVWLGCVTQKDDSDR
jgi:hypothetical protein